MDIRRDIDPTETQAWLDIKAAVASLKKFPEFNASLDGDNLVLKKYYHIGFAADTPNGLVVPVVKDADKKGVLAIPGGPTSNAKCSCSARAPAAISAAFRSADLGMRTVLVERYATLGGVCLNVGCIPSKALLHVAAVMDENELLAEHGIRFGKPEIDLSKLRGWKEKVVGKLTGGLSGMAKARKVEHVRGIGRFLDPNHLEVELTSGKGQDKTGEKKIVRFSKAIIAAGSQAAKPPFLPDDPRIVDSTAALELPVIPKRMLVIGGGIIGLEMATVYATLGAKIEIVELLDHLMTGADRDLVKVWEKMSSGRFDKVMLKTKTTGAKATAKGIEVSFEGEAAPASPQLYDLVLVAVGRAPNGKNIAAENAGVQVSDRGFISASKQMRTNVPHIFAIGDIIRHPMLAHKAVHEGHVAAEAAAGHNAHFDARQIPSVVHRSGSRMGGLNRDRSENAGNRIFEISLSLGRVGARDRQRARRRLHQTSVRGENASLHRRRNRRHARRGSDRGSLPCSGNGRRPGRHRQDHPPAPNVVRIGRHGRGSRRGRLHRSPAGEEKMSHCNLKERHYRGSGNPEPFEDGGFLPRSRELSPLGRNDEHV
jgi:pyruvate/2-oxoglutarate dehydrogenase complex dihydrolipoamide dehydrogenase (E3) component